MALQRMVPRVLEALVKVYLGLKSAKAELPAFAGT
jgi:hypothetical protein